MVKVKSFGLICVFVALRYIHTYRREFLTRSALKHSSNQRRGQSLDGGNRRRGNERPRIYRKSTVYRTSARQVINKRQKRKEAVLHVLKMFVSNIKRNWLKYSSILFIHKVKMSLLYLWLSALGYIVTVFHYLRQLNEVNGGDNAFVRCVSVCVCELNANTSKTVKVTDFKFDTSLPRDSPDMSSRNFSKRGHGVVT